MARGITRIKRGRIPVLICITAFLTVISGDGGFSAFAATAAITSPSLQDQIDANGQQVTDLSRKIAEYEAQLTKIGADKKTLKNAIAVLTVQRTEVEARISITQKQISITKLQIQQFGSDITNTQQTIAKNQGALGVYLRTLQKADGQSSLEQMLASGTLAEAWNDINSIVEIQGAVQGNLHALQTLKGKLSDSQNASKQKADTLTAQKQSLASQQASLAVTAQSKSELLTETNNEESKYQALLSEAKAQLASFTAFAQNAGGKGLLVNQTSCDIWGCYYNQRDAAWGISPLNGTEYTLADAGCLVTSMAMVMTHYGYSKVTPATINADSGNFAAYYPAFLLSTIRVAGVTATRKAAAIDATLASGNPVIVGLHAFGGTHFLVLTSGKRGSYMMRDPWFPNSKDVSFSSRYTIREIYEINKVVING